jgi:predicted nucleic acid-binding protein
VGTGASGLILDTNAVSSLAKQVPGITTALNAVASLFIPVPVIGEYRYGIAQSDRRTSLAKWFESFLADCLVLEITNETTHHYAAIRLELRRIGKPIPTNDIWIAALCRQHNFPLLSRDRHFDVVSGLKRLEW